MATEADRERNRRWRAAHLEEARARGRASYHKHKAKRQASSHAWYEANKETLARRRESSRYVKKDQDLRRLYGLTLKQFEEMSAAQGHRCKVCREPAPLVVDHDHQTNRVRGLLCTPCNRSLGYAKESPARLRALADYLG